ncbi:hypothetical protein [Streptomyces griseofuscus]|uniref:hypothetical protein n=1 Tax=Streptomyces griseofuscus TaxID=146922 RepID=UPI00369499D3
MSTPGYPNGVCTYGENRAPGSGCIKPSGHDGAHLVTPGDPSQLDDEQLCDSEFPGDDTHAGQLCELERGHTGQHEHLAVLVGSRHARRLTWTDTQPTG